MATKGFLLQGFTAHTHLVAIKHVLDCPDLKHAIVSVAFVNKAGVDFLAHEIKRLGSKVDVFVGIRNDITSRQGLRTLMENGANVHYVDTGARHILFHPKIYFARSNQVARMVIGSANLTPGGLNNNIEASATLDLDLIDEHDNSIVESVEYEFSKLVSEYPLHVAPIINLIDLDVLHAEGRLIDEASSFPPRGVVSKKFDGLSRIKLKVAPLEKTVQRAVLPKLPPLDSTTVEMVTPISSLPIVPDADFELVWESKPLTERDLMIPSGKTTHATGSINLDKGLLDAEIDHRHYFREEVFPALIWTLKSETVEEAFANFALIIKGKKHGEFNLRIGHTTNTASITYKQHNAMTRISWGKAKPFVSQANLLGRTMFLYRNANDFSRFSIEID